jgi:methylenetetrahydrofolate dehydrogenase (NADP+)/methenyltetrahydrofolate cyclohydrolase
MVKILNGRELADFIKERQAHDVRALRQAHEIFPKLAIVVTVDNPVIEVYMRMKQKYGADILIDVDIHRVRQDDAPRLIAELNKDPSVHGIIVQLPLENPDKTDEIVDLVAPEKDVDALGKNAIFDPATPTDLKAETLEADVIITATGSPAILYSDMIKQGAVVVDAGVAGEEGKTVGDLAEDVYERDDLTITPVKGGVGPLTVCALFENVIRAARESSQNS